MPEFKVSYTFQKYNGVMGIGVITAEADSLETIQEEAMKMAIKSIAKQHDEDEFEEETVGGIYENYCLTNFQSLTVEIKEL